MFIFTRLAFAEATRDSALYESNAQTAKLSIAKEHTKQEQIKLDAIKKQ